MSILRRYLAGHFLFYSLIALALTASALGATYFLEGSAPDSGRDESLNSTMGGQIQEQNNSSSPSPSSAEPPAGQQPASTSGATLDPGAETRTNPQPQYASSPSSAETATASPEPHPQQQRDSQAPPREELAFVSGTVKRANGDPLAFESVYANFPYPSLVAEPTYTTKTDGQGRYRFSLKPGPYRICIRDGGSQNCHPNILELKTGDDFQGIDIIVGQEVAAASIAGTVSQLGHGPQKDYPVYANDYQSGNRIVTGSTDGNGAYRLHVPAGTYAICTVGWGFDGSPYEHCYPDSVTVGNNESRENIDIEIPIS